MEFTLRYDKDVLETVRADIAKAPKTLQTFAEKTIPDLIQKELKPLTTEPRQPDLPFIWSYDPVKQARARRWYFANKVRGRAGGRYARTHQLVRNWKIKVNGSIQQGTIISVSNNTPGLDYVQGPLQVPGHRDSGWADYETVVLTAEEKATDTLIEAWYDITTGGGRYA